MPKIVRIVLMRHGTTQMNIERRYVSRTNAPLLPDSQAELRPLRGALASGRPLAYTSDLQRCRDTLAYVCPYSASRATVDVRLRELDFGQWEGRTYNDLQAEPRYRAWLDDRTAVAPPDGESWSAFSARTAAVWAAVLEAAHPEGRAVRRTTQHTARSNSNRSRRPSVRSCLHKNSRNSRATQFKPTADVLIVTHGGVVRELYTIAFPHTSYWDVPAPTGGGILIVAQMGRNKAWRFLRSVSLT
ncbi:histidine phosphatase family protein [Paenibacillus sp. 481]|nr:histidine phosphatase family protein [Paenibacillus sp. 481]